MKKKNLGIFIDRILKCQLANRSQTFVKKQSLFLWASAIQITDKNTNPSQLPKIEIKTLFYTSSNVKDTINHKCE